MRAHGARGFAFSDDDFPIGGAAGIERLAKTCDLITASKAAGRIEADMQFACQARIADFIMVGRVPNRGVMEKMKAAGLVSIALGVETFVDRLLKSPSVNKVGVTSVDCTNVLDAMLDVGLTPLMNLIIGIPEQEPTELAFTLSTALGYIQRGCEINVTGPMYALPGAPLMTNPDYPIADQSWVHPQTGTTVSIPHRFIPRDAQIAALSERFEQDFSDTLDALMKERGWEGRILHKRAKNCLSLMVSARGIGDEALVERCRRVLDDLLAGKLRIAS